MKRKFILAHMNSAKTYADLSQAVRRKVGCVVVKDDTIIGIGYNGTPSGWSNECEDKDYWNPQFEDLHYDELDELYPHADAYGRYRLVTKKQVIHAEMNALAKIAKSTSSSEGATMFVTTAPCIECAKMIHACGISEVYYLDVYKSDEGLRFLQQCGIPAEQITKDVNV